MEVMWWSRRTFLRETESGVDEGGRPIDRGSWVV